MSQAATNQAATNQAEPVVFLFDVDNTLLDNDRVTDDLRAHLIRSFGAASAQRYWDIFEGLRRELGYADYLGALQRYRSDDQNDPALLLMSSFLLDYPFSDRLYDGALAALKHLSQWGSCVILSDGDAVFQPRKVQRSGLWRAVGGNVLIYIHKEQMMDQVRARYPARHYVLIDDKLRLLAAIKAVFTDSANTTKQLTTVFPRQGHYAHDPQNLAQYSRAADISIDRIGELVRYDLSQLIVAGTSSVNAGASNSMQGDFNECN